MDGETARQRARPLLEKTADSEKITINLGYVDLGRIDLLVQEGFYSNRSDLSAPRSAASWERMGKRSPSRSCDARWNSDLRDIGRAELEAAKAAGEKLDVELSASRASRRTLRRTRAGDDRVFYRTRRLACQRRGQVGAGKPDPMSASARNEGTFHGTDFADAMRRATLATREHDVLKATKIILQAVTGRAAAGDVDAPHARSTTSTLRLIQSEPHAERRETDFSCQSFAADAMGLGDVLCPCVKATRSPASIGSAVYVPRARPPMPEGAMGYPFVFLRRGRTRLQALYSASRPDAPRGSIVMLHELAPRTPTISPLAPT